MSKPNQLTIIETDVLVTATGGAPRSSSSSGNLMLQQQMSSVTDALSSLKNQNTGSSLSKWLPMMMMAKMMRG